MRDRMEAAARAADLLARELLDPEFLSWLERDGVRAELHPPTWRNLSFIAAHARAVAKSLPVAPGRAKQGPRAGGLDPRTMCALFIVEAWDLARGKRPGSQNSDANKAAEAFWLATGGRPLGEPWSLERWRRPFKAALASTASMEEHRTIVRRALEQDRPKP